MARQLLVCASPMDVPISFRPVNLTNAMLWTQEPGLLQDDPLRRHGSGLSGNYSQSWRDVDDERRSVSFLHVPYLRQAAASSGRGHRVISAAGLPRTERTYRP